jgi:hypothetical protein
LSIKDLYEFTDQIGKVSAAIQADPRGVTFAPSDDTCRFCKANALCPARHEFLLGGLTPEVGAAVSAAQAGTDVVYPDTKLLTVDQLSRLLTAAPGLESFFKDVREHVYGLITTGTQVPGWKLVQGKANRQWVDVDMAAKLLRKQLSADEVQPRGMISPAQAEKLLKGQTLTSAYEEKLKQLIVAPEGKPTLVPESDKRPSLHVGETFVNLNKEQQESELLA